MSREVLSNNVQERESLSSSSSSSSDEATWIETNLYRVECVHFVASKKSPDRCGCGRLRRNHLYLESDEGRNLCSLRSGIRWNPKLHTKMFPTDAFGTIEFQGGPHPTKARYTRLSADTNPVTVLHLLFYEWKLRVPNLVITVFGGLADFELQPKLKRVFQVGLIKAATTTGAWIISTGLDTGVSKHVGDAVSEHTSSMFDSNIVTIGIAPWGVVQHREHLIGREKVCPYHSISSRSKREAVLNKGHTHFLLCDNGSSEKFGCELQLRRMLEQFMAHQYIDMRKHGGLKSRVPIVAVLVEGGPHAFSTVYQLITDPTPVPVVICDGSGRAADIISFGVKFSDDRGKLPPEIRDQLLNVMMRTFKVRKEVAEELYREMEYCLRHKDLISVFQMDDNMNADIDNTILTALLHTSSSKLTPAGQLSLTMAWNRPDIARANVFKFDRIWKPHVLENAMFDALINDRLEFVKLLLENGVSMSNFLTEARLEQMYNTPEIQANARFLKTLYDTSRTREKFSLRLVGQYIENLIGHGYRHPYCHKSTWSFAFTDVESSLQSSNGATYPLTSYAESKFRYPYTELMQWALLTGRHEMARYMMFCGEESIAKALLAVKLCNSIRKSLVKELALEFYNELKAQEEEFEKNAVDLQDACYSVDKAQTMRLITYELRAFSKHTCLSLAYLCKSKSFLSHACTQSILSDLWYGGLQQCRLLDCRVVLALVCGCSVVLWPLLVILIIKYRMLEFKTKKQLSDQPQTLEEYLADMCDSSSSSTSSGSSTTSYDISGEHVIHRDGSHSHETSHRSSTKRQSRQYEPMLTDVVINMGPIVEPLSSPTADVQPIIPQEATSSLRPNRHSCPDLMSSTTNLLFRDENENEDRGMLPLRNPNLESLPSITLSDIEEERKHNDQPQLQQPIQHPWHSLHEDVNIASQRSQEQSKKQDSAKHARTSRYRSKSPKHKRRRRRQFPGREQSAPVRLETAPGRSLERENNLEVPSRRRSRYGIKRLADVDDMLRGGDYRRRVSYQQERRMSLVGQTARGHRVKFSSEKNSTKRGRPTLDHARALEPMLPDSSFPSVMHPRRPFDKGFSFHTSATAPLFSALIGSHGGTLGVPSTITGAIRPIGNNWSRYPDGGNDNDMTRQDDDQLDVRKKLYEFINAPITRYHLHFVFFIFFLICFVHMSSVRYPREHLYWVEYFIHAYVYIYFLDKFRELIISDGSTLIRKLKSHFTNFWNLFDYTVCLMTIGGTIGRYLSLTSESPYQSTRSWLSFCCALWHIRILELMQIWVSLGPTIYMTKEMVKQMMPLIVLLFISVLSFGIVRQGIMQSHTNEHFTIQTVKDILLKPYFMLYGEVYAGEIDPMDWPDDTRDDTFAFIVPTAMVVFLIMAIFLIISVVIARFNEIYSSVRLQSELVHKFLRYACIIEYENMPFLPPPFTVFSWFHGIFRFIKRWYRLRGTDQKISVESAGLKLFLSKDEIEVLHDFEEECVERHCREVERKKNEVKKVTLKSMSDSIGSMFYRLDELHQRQYSSKIALLLELSQLEQNENTKLTDIDSQLASMYQLIQAQSNHFSKLSENISHLLDSQPVNQATERSIKAPFANDHLYGTSRVRAKRGVPIDLTTSSDEDNTSVDNHHMPISVSGWMSPRSSSNLQGGGDNGDQQIRRRIIKEEERQPTSVIEEISPTMESDAKTLLKSQSVNFYNRQMSPALKMRSSRRKSGPALHNTVSSKLPPPSQLHGRQRQTSQGTTTSSGGLAYSHHDTRWPSDVYSASPNVCNLMNAYSLVNRLPSNIVSASAVRWSAAGNNRGDYTTICDDIDLTALKQAQSSSSSRSSSLSNLGGDADRQDPEERKQELLLAEQLEREQIGGYVLNRIRRQSQAETHYMLPESLEKMNNSHPSCHSSPLMQRLSNISTAQNQVPSAASVPVPTSSGHYNNSQQQMISSKRSGFHPSSPHVRTSVPLQLSGSHYDHPHAYFHFVSSEDVNDSECRLISDRHGVGTDADVDSVNNENYSHTPQIC